MCVDGATRLWSERFAQTWFIGCSRESEQRKSRMQKRWAAWDKHLGLKLLKRCTSVWSESPLIRRLFEVASFVSIQRSSRPTSITLPTVACLETAFAS